MRLRYVVVLSLLAILSFVVFRLAVGQRVVLQRADAPDAEAAAPTTSVVKAQSSLAQEQGVHAVLIEWRDVPPWLATVVASPLDNNLVTARRPMTWDDILAHIRWNAAFRGDPVAEDRELRAAGFVAAVDMAVFAECGFTIEKAHEVPEHYFPMVPSRVSKARPTDTDLATSIQRILADPKSVLQHLPASLRHGELEEAVKTRAAVLAFTVADRAALRDVLLHEMRTSPHARVRAAAAATLLTKSGNESVAEWVRQTLEGPDAACLGAALSGVENQGFAVLANDRAFTFFAPATPGGRDVDRALLATAGEGACAPDARREVMRALLGRCDDPEIRRFVVNTLQVTTDSEMASLILSGTHGLAADAGYRQALGRWLQSEEDWPALWAIRNAAFLPDGGGLEGLMFERLRRDDRRYVQAASLYLINHGSASPASAHVLCQELLQKWGTDPLLGTLISAAQNRLDSTRHQPESAARRVQKALARGFAELK